MGGKVNAEERAVVLTATLKVAGLVPFSASDAGFTEQVDAAGAPVHARFTVPVKPDVPLKERL
jgi:hypothetical protein